MNPARTYRGAGRRAHGLIRQQNLFDVRSFGEIAGIRVPAAGDRATAATAHCLIATGFVPAGRLTPGTRIEFQASGTMLAGGPDPRLIADWALGPNLAPTVLRPVGGDTAVGFDGDEIDNRGVEVSYQTAGPNALGKRPGEVVHWSIELDLILSKERVRGTGAVRWSTFGTSVEAAAWELGVPVSITFWASK